MKFCVSTCVGTWTNWSTFEPDPDHSPDAGTGKSEIESRSNRHLTQSRPQVTGCTVERYCLLHVVVQWPGSFRGRSTFLYVVQLRSFGASNLTNFRISACFPIHHVRYTYWRSPTLQRHVVLEWFYSVTRRKSFVGGTYAPPSALLVIFRNAPLRNSAAVTCGLVKKYNTVPIVAERRRHAAGYRKLLRYRLLPRRFSRTKNACGAVRCGIFM